MELQKTTEEQYDKLIQIGYPKLTFIDALERNLPTVLLALQWVGVNKGIYLSLHPEFYEDGINWNWQLWWYLPKEEWIERDYEDKSNGTYYTYIEGGTYMFGDNGEYPTKPEAEFEALNFALNMIINGKDYANKHVNPKELRE